MINIKRIAGFLALPVLIAALTGCGTPKQITFENKFVKGQELYYKITNSVSTKTVDGKGNEMVQENKSEADYIQRIKDVTEKGDFITENVYENIKMTITQDGKEQEFPSSGMDVKPVTLKLDKRGVIIEKDGEEIDEKITKNSIESYLFPEKPVAVGESWDANYENTVPLLPGLNKVEKVDATFTFTGYETVNNTKCAVIDQTVTRTSSIVKDKETEMPLMIDIQETSNATGTNKYYYDYKKGIMVKNESDMKITIDRTIEDLRPDDEKAEVKEGEEKPSKKESVKIESTAKTVTELMDKPPVKEEGPNEVKVQEEVKAETGESAAPAEKTEEKKEEKTQ